MLRVVQPKDIPRGDYRPSAVLRLLPENIAIAGYGQWLKYHVDGFGETCGIPFLTENGRYVGFEHHYPTRKMKFTGTHILTPFQSSDEAFLLDLILEEFEFTTADLNWIRGDLKLTPHQIVRLDDNGIESSVGVFACKADAQAKIRTFEPAGHKQTYWSKPV